MAGQANRNLGLSRLLWLVLACLGAACASGGGNSGGGGGGGGYYPTDVGGNQCIPQCNGKECGSNGCGGVCGACPAAAPICTEGVCKAQCVPQCGGKKCGDDGCGGLCGACGWDKPICTAGQCTAPAPTSECGNGTCEAGESAATCAADCGVVPTGHFCDGNCGGSGNGCYCDSSCAQYGDCCNASGDGKGGATCSGSTCAQCNGGGSTGPQCGNGKCEAGETAASCAADCKGACVPKCPAGTCGNDGCLGVCECSGGASCVGGVCIYDPCQGVPESGICFAGGTAVKRCVTPTGNGTAKLEIQACAAWESCTVSPMDGTADCITKPGFCIPSTATCSAQADKADVCDAAGNTTKYPCKGCVDTAVGAACQGMVPTKAMTGTVKYEAKGMDPSKTGWAPFGAPVALREALVLVLHHTGTDYQLIDAGTTDDNGGFQVQVPVAPGANDMVLILLAKVNPFTQKVQYALGKPDVGDGQQPNDTPPASSNYWSWPIAANVWVDGKTWTIKLSDGSGAARVFDYLRYVFGQTGYLSAKDGKTVVVWLRYGTGWDCGACFLNDNPAIIGGAVFQTQILFPGYLESEEFWADAVTAHELGHWVMAAYGKSPGEGGPHTVGKKSMPGMAWSEGWATGFSSMARGSGLYFDKQYHPANSSTSTFWVDLDTPMYSKAYLDWNYPDSTGGLLQPMDENEVAAGLWALTDQTKPPLAQPENKKFFNALQSDRLTKPPFARGYTKHTWDLDENHDMVNVKDTMKSVPMLADFLDALLCLPNPYIAPSYVEQAFSPYPYSSDYPICN